MRYHWKIQSVYQQCGFLQLNLHRTQCQLPDWKYTHFAIYLHSTHFFNWSGKMHVFRLAGTLLDLHGACNLCSLLYPVRVNLSGTEASRKPYRCKCTNELKVNIRQSTPLQAAILEGQVSALTQQQQQLKPCTYLPLSVMPPCPHRHKHHNKICIDNALYDVSTETARRQKKRNMKPQPICWWAWQTWVQSWSSSRLYMWRFHIQSGEL